MPKASTKSSLTKAIDREVSKQVRNGAEWRCVSCGGYFTGIYLQCAHIVGRENRRLRFCYLNTLSLCAGCHRMFTGDPVGFSEFIKERFPLEWSYSQTHKNTKVKRSLKDLQALLANARQGSLCLCSCERLNSEDPLGENSCPGLLYE